MFQVNRQVNEHISSVFLFFFLRKINSHLNINNVSVHIVTKSITDSYNFENFELSCE